MLQTTATGGSTSPATVASFNNQSVALLGSIATFQSSGVTLTGVPGTATVTTDNSAAGFIGEVISSTIVYNTLTNAGSLQNITKITLTPGDWFVTGNIGWYYSGTIPSGVLYGGISPTSATLPAWDATLALYNYTGGSADFFNMVVPSRRVQVTSSAIIIGGSTSGGTTSGAVSTSWSTNCYLYLVIDTASSGRYIYGNITARRIR